MPTMQWGQRMIKMVSGGIVRSSCCISLQAHAGCQSSRRVLPVKNLGDGRAQSGIQNNRVPIVRQVCRGAGRSDPEEMPNRLAALGESSRPTAMGRCFFSQRYETEGLPQWLLAHHRKANPWAFARLQERLAPACASLPRGRN